MNTPKKRGGQALVEGRELTFAEIKIHTFWIVFLAMVIILPIHIFIPVALGLYLGLLWMGWVNPIDDKKDT